MASLFCPVCGTENPSTRLFCRKCAADLHAPVSTAAAAPEPTPAPIPVRPIIVGGGIALVIVALIIGVLVVLGGSPAASPSPGPTPSAATASVFAPTPAPIATQAPAATAVVTPAPEPTGTPEPGESQTPSVDTLKAPRTASCTGTNGTATAGYIHLSWTASGVANVRLSIDPPAPNTAYDYGYDDYPAIGSADVPFTCDPPNSDAGGAYHLYVVTTEHERGYFAYRYTKVYLKV